MLVFQPLFRERQPSECLCDQFVLVRHSPHGAPEVLKRKLRAVTSHHLEPLQKLAAAIATETSSEREVADVCEGDARSPLVKIDTVGKRHWLEPKVDQIRDERSEEQTSEL